MAAIPRASEHSKRQISSSAQAFESASPIARLASLHAEAEETARLANLLGRSIYAALMLPAAAALALALGGADLAEGVTWTAFVLCATGAIAFAYRRTIGQPFERAALKSFSQDLRAILVFAGVAWGAGAFLALPSDSAPGMVVLFAAGTGTAIAVLLRERESAFLFLAPVTALASFACVLRPLPGGALEAAAVLIAGAAVAGAATLAERWSRRAGGGEELAGLPFA